MIKDFPLVHLCSNVDAMPIGKATDEIPLKFEVELGVSGQKYPKKTFKYIVTAKWDDYNLRES